MDFSRTDLEQFSDKGITLTQIQEQLDNFKSGFPFFQLEKAATINNGIQRVEQESLKAIEAYYESNAKKLQICKFVPASGAASRMFKDLFSFMESYDGSATAKAKFESDKSFYSIYNFIHKIENFAFYNDLKAALAVDNLSIDELIKSEKYGVIIEYLLTEKGLSYGTLPKGLLKFHNYETENRTPIEEHLVEAANYAKSANNKAFLHFTVSPQHRERFMEKVESVKGKYENDFNLTYDIEYSEQESYTDTIAVSPDLTPFKSGNDRILFRPGGHGALIENLNRLTADIVFIKNIDNVVPDNLKAETYTYKKVIGGVLLQYQAQIFDYLFQLNRKITSELIEEITQFFQNKLSTVFPADFKEKAIEEKVEILRHKLNRPIRVCGMVKNEGEPGGGPFWSKNADGSVSLQIVESSQVDADDANQMDIMQKASHFNPVDLVCSLKNHKGEKYDLLKYRDPQTGFITEKSKDGRDLLAQELPGLWNGAMADWNTIFVEVSLVTFNPVKKVSDLLRDEHQ